MSNYKLAPLEPTPEMVRAAEDAYMPFGDMGLAIRMAILEAPEVEREPVAWMTSARVFGEGLTADRQEAEGWLKNWPDKTAPLYLHPQPSPDVSALVEALESLLEVQDEDCRYDHQGYCQNHNLDHVDDGCRVARAKTALAAHRKQGGGQS